MRVYRPFTRLPRPVTQNLVRLVLALLMLALAAAVVPRPAAAAPYADFVLDANSGRVLHSDSADMPRFPASLTKMMTLYVTFEMLKKGRLSEDTVLTASVRASQAAPSKLGLKPGDKIKVSDAIRALVTKSANDVALVIAENLASSETKFARYMTWRAKELGMSATTFRNASGLPNPDQRTTARDLATLAIRLHDDFPEYYGYFQTKYFAYKGKRYKNHNSLLFTYPGTEGMKTGYIRASGFNLVTSVKRGGKHVIAVVMGGRTARSRDSRMRQILDETLKKASSKRTRKKTTAPAAEVATAVPAKKPIATQVAIVPPEPKQTSSKDRARLAQLIEATSGGRSGVSGWTAPQRKTPGVAGGYHVQVGAYGSEAEAMRRLARVQQDAGQMLAGADPIAVTYAVADKTWYRARFTGFDESHAHSACQNLKKRKIDCVVMRAQ
ncbi:MAG: D-alanyl-D-alanine carboxypeptidase family protein [Hyphomicrobiaceae bacterium]